MSSQKGASINTLASVVIIAGSGKVLSGIFPPMICRSAVPQTRDGFAAARKMPAMCREETSPVADDCATPTAIGVHAFGRRHVLGVSIKVSEAEIHRRAFLESL